MTVEELMEELEAMPATAVVFVLVRETKACRFELGEVDYDHGEVIIVADAEDEDDE